MSGEAEGRGARRNEEEGARASRSVGESWRSEDEGVCDQGNRRTWAEHWRTPGDLEQSQSDQVTTRECLRGWRGRRIKMASQTLTQSFPVPPAPSPRLQGTGQMKKGAGGEAGRPLVPH